MIIPIMIARVRDPRPERRNKGKSASRKLNNAMKAVSAMPSHQHKSVNSDRRKFNIMFFMFLK